MPAHTQPVGAELSNQAALTLGKQTDLEGRHWEPAMKVPANLIQLATCKEYFGAPDTVTNNLTVATMAAEALVKANLVSWTTYVINKVKEIANELFSTKQEVAWWSNWATSLVVDFVDEAIPKPIGILIKAFANALDKGAAKSIADARKDLVSKGEKAVITYRDNQRKEARAYYRAYYKKLQASDEDCAGKVRVLQDHINKEWPWMGPESIPEAKKLAKLLMTWVRKKEGLPKAKSNYEACVKAELPRHGGPPSAEKERKIREDCRKRHGYGPPTPPTAC